MSVLVSMAPMLNLSGPLLEVLADDWIDGRRVIQVRLTTSMYERIFIILPKDSPLLAITFPDNGRTELPLVYDQGWWLRLEGLPVEGIRITFEFSGKEPIMFLLVEEKTGLPYFSGFSTAPEPGTMKSPGVFTQVIPTDFTVIYRTLLVAGSGSE